VAFRKNWCWQLIKERKMAAKKQKKNDKPKAAATEKPKKKARK
jgi:hypothetical protein